MLKLSDFHSLMRTFEQWQDLWRGSIASKIACLSQTSLPYQLWNTFVTDFSPVSAVKYIKCKLSDADVLTNTLQQKSIHRLSCQGFYRSWCSARYVKNVLHDKTILCRMSWDLHKFLFRHLREGDLVSQTHNFGGTEAQQEILRTNASVPFIPGKIFWNRQQTHDSSKATEFSDTVIQDQQWMMWTLIYSQNFHFKNYFNFRVLA